MVTTLDVAIGQLYWLKLPEREEPALAEFRKELRDGRLKFVREGTDLDILVEEQEFARMRCRGDANRIPLTGKGAAATAREIDPASLLDPNEPSIRLAEQARRLRAIEKLKRARTLRFYVMRYDEDPTIGRGHRAVDHFVSENYLGARAAGFDWRPDAATILRAAADCGRVGERPLTVFFDARGKYDRSTRWNADVLEAAEQAITFYWSERPVRVCDATAQFDEDFKVIAKEREARGRPITPTDPLDKPTAETLRLWIKDSANWFSWCQKYGRKDADRRFRGRGRPMQASRPLELVMMDHTRLDVWAVVQDDNGDPMVIERPWLTMAIDVHTRMILGLSLSYEQPSVYSALECLRQVVRRKEQLIEEYGPHKGATDGWGRPTEIIVDNGWEFTGTAFQTACEAVGIDVIWAPVRNPMFKAYVERVFGTFNAHVWHRLPGGIPLTPRDRSLLELDPRIDAVYTRDSLEQALWNAIVTIYHVETHSGIDMAPANKWRRGIEVHGRPTVDDISLLDKVVGFSQNCLLTAEGVTMGGQRFHDPAITTMLMNRLAHRGKARAQRHSVTASKTVPVVCVSQPGDMSKAFVWDPTTKTSVMLPNWNAEFAKGLSWYLGKLIKDFAREQNLKFHSDSEKSAARVAHRKFLLDMLPGLKFGSKRKTARVFDPMPELAPGDQLQVIDGAPDDYAVPHDIAATRTIEDRRVIKGHRRGGAAATAKATRTRRANSQTKAAATATAAPRERVVKEAGVEAEVIVDAASMLAALRNELDGKGTSS